LNKNHTSTLGNVWQLAFFTIFLILVFSVLFQTIYANPYSGTGLFFEFASGIMNGQLPYRDFILEYPPFSLFFFLIPRLISSNYLAYTVLYQVETVIFALIGLLVLYDVSRRLGKAPWKLMTVYSLGILAIGPVTCQQFDLFPAILVLLAVYFFWLDKHPAAWALLALGTMTKIYPAAIAPLFLIVYVRNHQYRLIWFGIFTFGLVSLAVLLPFLISSPGSLTNLYEYHAQRGIQIETIYSSILMVGQKLGWITAHSGFGFGSWNIEGTATGTIADLSTLLLVVLLAFTYWQIYVRSKQQKIDIMRLGSCSFLVVLIVLITSKILSPQYLVWLIPLLPLVMGRWRLVVWTMFVVVGALTYVIFPHLYLQLVDFDSTAVTVLALRNLLLILMTIFTAVSLKTSVKS
jgi:uncharacterized membrane protein